VNCSLVFIPESYRKRKLLSSESLTNIFSNLIGFYYIISIFQNLSLWQKGWRC
jgi:hypothetical protein